MSHLPNWALNWKTADMEAAEWMLDDAAEHAETVMAQTDRALYEVESNQPPPTEEEVELLKQYAAGPKAPAEFKELAKRVERGEFSWTDYLSGSMDRDSGVTAAMDAMMRKAEEPDDEAGAGQEEPRPQPTSFAPQAPVRMRRPLPDDDDDDFSHRTYMR